MNVTRQIQSFLKTSIEKLTDEQTQTQLKCLRECEMARSGLNYERIQLSFLVNTMQKKRMPSSQIKVCPKKGLSNVSNALNVEKKTGTASLYDGAVDSKKRRHMNLSKKKIENLAKANWWNCLESLLRSKLKTEKCCCFHHRRIFRQITSSCKLTIFLKQFGLTLTKKNFPF